MRTSGAPLSAACLLLAACLPPPAAPADPVASPEEARAGALAAALVDAGFTLTEEHRITIEAATSLTLPLAAPPGESFAALAFEEDARPGPPADLDLDALSAAGTIVAADRTTDLRAVVTGRIPTGGARLVLTTDRGCRVRVLTARAAPDRLLVTTAFFDRDPVVRLPAAALLARLSPAATTDAPAPEQHPLVRGERRVEEVRRPRGRCVAHVAAGSAGLDLLTLELRDESGRLVAADRARRPHAVLVDCAGTDGTGRLTTTVLAGAGSVERAGASWTRRAGVDPEPLLASPGPAQLDLELAALTRRAARRGLSPPRVLHAGPLAAGARRSVPLPLGAGDCLALAAVADRRDADLDLVLFDEADRILVESRETRARAELLYCADRVLTARLDLIALTTAGESRLLAFPLPPWPSASPPPVGLRRAASSLLAGGLTRLIGPVLTVRLAADGRAELPLDAGGAGCRGLAVAADGPLDRVVLLDGEGTHPALVADDTASLAWCGRAGPTVVHLAGPAGGEASVALLDDVTDDSPGRPR